MKFRTAKRHGKVAHAVLLLALASVVHGQGPLREPPTKEHRYQSAKAIDFKANSHQQPEGRCQGGPAKQAGDFGQCYDRADSQHREGEGKPIDFPTPSKELTVDYRNAIANRLEWLKRGLPDEKDAVNLYIIGWIQYLDESERLRRMGFCRKYDFRSQRFQREQDEDYEYED